MSEKPKLGIVMICYNNVNGFKRLLKSLDNVDYDGDSVPLIISIDYSGDDSVYKAAMEFDWKYGEKIINAHEENLGLRTHILSCGDYMEKYDLDAIAVLEDDIFVSPSMYTYMKAAVPFYCDDERIAGLSLYKHEFNINGRRPFYDLNDGGDTYFVQYAMSWGQVWLRKRWREFRTWYDNKGWENIPAYKIPQNLASWKNSWLKFHIMYCIDQNKYFVYPRNSLTTNFSDAGSHVKVTTTKMQVPFLSKAKHNWNLSTLDSTNAVYDAFFESTKLSNITDGALIDIYGVKEYPDNIGLVLTTRILPYEVKKSWALQLRPAELNVILNNRGNEIFLYDLQKPSLKKKNKEQLCNILEYDLKGANIMSPALCRYIWRIVSPHIRARVKKMKHLFKK